MSIRNTEQVEKRSTLSHPQVDSPGADSKRKRLVSLLRGYFASPVIATLGEMGITEGMLAGEFSLMDFESVPNQEILSVLFHYLYSIGLITRGTVGEYALTPEGRTALGRDGAFSLLMSYAEYFHELPSLLAKGNSKPSVNRLRNVRGSGQLHSRKFFPSAFGFFSSDAPSAIIDIGCGDGRFLQLSREAWPKIGVFGVDLSETAVQTTQHRLDPSAEGGSIAVSANGYDVEIWSQAVPEHIRYSSCLIISLWFVGHEFSNRSPERIVGFFSSLHKAFPQAQVLLGEINKISPALLAEDHDLSIMPEFLLFHELSGQGVLTWEEWHQILDSIPYVLKKQQPFDEVRPRSAPPVPASFLWLLQPESAQPPPKATMQS